MTMDTNQSAETILAHAKQTADRLGVKLNTETNELRAYTAQSLLRLGPGAGKAGYDRAVRAEGLNVFVEAAGRSVNLADIADAEIVGVIVGGLAFAAAIINPAG